MDDLLHELYQNIILEHNKRPRHYGASPDYTHTAEGYNPLCGDRLSVYLKLVKGRLESVRFEAAACAICKASASIMAASLQEKSLAAAAESAYRAVAILTTDAEVDLTMDGEFVVLAGIRRFPSRIECARLPWKTYEVALKQPVRTAAEVSVEKTESELP